MSARKVRTAQPRPGEIPLKEWIMTASEQAGYAPRTFESYLHNGRIVYPKVRRVNRRTVFVVNDNEAPQFPLGYQPCDGEITLREWIAIEAEIRGMSFRNAQSNYYRHKIPAPPLRRVNHHVIYVQTNMPYAS